MSRSSRKIPRSLRRRLEAVVGAEGGRQQADRQLGFSKGTAWRWLGGGGMTSVSLARLTSALERWEAQQEGRAREIEQDLRPTPSPQPVNGNGAHPPRPVSILARLEAIELQSQLVAERQEETRCAMVRLEMAVKRLAQAWGVEL